AMARRTSRRAQISLNHKRFVVDARGIERELIDRNLVLLHVVFISVAMGAGLGDVYLIYGRLGVIRWTNVMHGVAVRADGDIRVSLGQHLAVHARLVLTELIRS